MADQSETGSRHGGLYFIGGALVVVAGIGAFVALGGAAGTRQKPGVDIKIETPKPPAKTQ